MTITAVGDSIIRRKYPGQAMPHNGINGYPAAILIWKREFLHTPMEYGFPVLRMNTVISRSRCISNIR